MLRTDQYLAQARATRVSGQAGRRFESLDALAKAATIRPAPELRNEAIASMALHDLRVARRLPAGPDVTPVAALDRHLNRYARGDRAGNITVRRLHDDAEVVALPGFDLHPVFLRFSAEGRYLAAKYDQIDRPINALLIWDLEHRNAVLNLTNAIVARAVDFHPRQPMAAVGQLDGSINLYDLSSASLIKRIACPARPYSLSFNPQGDLLAISSQAGSVIVLVDWARETIVHKLPHPDAAYGLDWHPEGLLLASGCADHRVYLWDTRQGQLRRTLEGHASAVIHLKFAPDGEQLVSAGWDSTLYLWDTVRQEPLLRIPGKSSCLEFDASGARLGFTADGNTLNLFEVAGKPACRTLVAESALTAWDAAFSPDGRLLAVTTTNGVVFWDTNRRNAANYIRLPWGRSVQFTDDGRDLIVSAKGVLQCWPVTTEDRDPNVRRIGPPQSINVHKGAENACLISGGRRVAIAGSGSGLLLDLDRPGERKALSGHVNATFISASPDGQWIATGAWPSGDVVIWNAQTGDHVRALSLTEPGRVKGSANVRFSPDGRWLVVGAQGEYLLFAVGTWELHRRLAGDPTIRHSVTAFSPDARLLAIRRTAHAVQLISPSDGRELALLPGEQPFPLCFSPDGTLLMVAERDTVRVWDLRRLREGLAKLKLDWDLPPYPPVSDPAPRPRLKIQVVSR